MTKTEFTQWFYEHVDEMIDAGILHPDSSAAKWVRLSLGAAVSHYESRINELENRLAELDGKEATKQLAFHEMPKQGKKEQRKQPPRVVGDKPTPKPKPVKQKQETKTPAPKKKKIANTSGGWLV